MYLGRYFPLVKSAPCIGVARNANTYRIGDTWTFSHLERHNTCPSLPAQFEGSTLPVSIRVCLLYGFDIRP
jgi:hypothetical protein